jgi:hypothetical protein
MQLTHLSSRALLAVSAVSLAAAAGAQAPQPPLPTVPASKAADSALIEVGRASVPGAVVATARAELAGGAVALLVASQPRPGSPPAFVLFVVGDAAGGGYALLAHEAVAGVSVIGAPTVVLTVDPRLAASRTLVATVGAKAPDGGAEERTFVWRLSARGLFTVLALPPSKTLSPERGRSGTRRALEILRSSSSGLNDLLARTTVTDCAADGTCSESVEATSYRFDGVSYTPRPYAIPFVEKITASSELPSRGGLVDYSAGAAVDGRLDTAWCEGEPGAGWFQKLELTFSPAQRVKAVSIVPGLGTGDAFREVTRPRRVRVLLPGAGKVEAELADEPRAQRIAIPEGERVFGMTLVIVDVYKGKREDACISELDVEVEP